MRNNAGLAIGNFSLNSVRRSRRQRESEHVRKGVSAPMGLAHRAPLNSLANRLILLIGVCGGVSQMYGIIRVPRFQENARAVRASTTPSLPFRSLPYTFLPHPSITFSLSQSMSLTVLAILLCNGEGMTGI